jgi:hypothetical protein
MASQNRVYVRDESKEMDPQAQMQAQSSYRSGVRTGERLVGEPGYPAPRVATGTSRDALGVDPNSLSRQRY